jgi:8-oxo-dGTP pyrophosphatase MutT (NUDIX family)
MGNSQEKQKVYNQPRKWELISQDKEYETPVFDLYKKVARHPENGTGTFYVVDTPAWINVIAETSDGHILLIDQYRHGVDSITTEIPGGMVDPGETPLEAAKRELLEETGYESARWDQIGLVEANPAIMNNQTFTFLARECSKVQEAQPDPQEEIRVWKTNSSKLFRLIDDGTIRHALVVAALMHYMRWLEHSKR